MRESYTTPPWPSCGSRFSDKASHYRVLGVYIRVIIHRIPTRRFPIENYFLRVTSESCGVISRPLHCQPLIQQSRIHLLQARGTWETEYIHPIVEGNGNNVLVVYKLRGVGH